MALALKEVIPKVDLLKNLKVDGALREMKFELKTMFARYVVAQANSYYSRVSLLKLTKEIDKFLG